MTPLYGCCNFKVYTAFLLRFNCIVHSQIPLTFPEHLLKMKHWLVLQWRSQNSDTLWCLSVTMTWDRQWENYFSAWFPPSLRGWDCLPRDPIRLGCGGGGCVRRHVHAWARESWSEGKSMCAHRKERGRVWVRAQMMLLVEGDGAGFGVPSTRFPPLRFDLCVLSVWHLTFSGKSCSFFCCWNQIRLLQAFLIFLCFVCVVCRETQNDKGKGGGWNRQRISCVCYK